MSVERIRLRKLLQLMYADERMLTTQLRNDLRQERDRLAGDSGGGDFYVPFWEAAKRHVAERSDLRDEVAELIMRNRRRQRLYPILRDGFLSWWNEARRQRNEPLQLRPETVRAAFSVPDFDAEVRVENVLAINVSDHSSRIIYPYFVEEPVLEEEAARVGLWLLGQSLPDYPLQDVRILDVMRGNAFALSTSPLQGDEESLFNQNFTRILERWRALRPDYGLD